MGGGPGRSTGGGSSVVSKPADCTDVLASTVDANGNSLITLVDAMNYSFSSSISATTTKVAANSDLTFDWSAITIDMLGHPFDPMTSVDMMQVVLWNVTQTEFLQGINDELLDTNDMVGAGVLETGNAMSSARFLQVTGPGGSPVPEETLLSYVDPAKNPPAQNTYAVMVASGVVLGQGTKMLAFFEPDPSETNTAVQLTNASTTLEYSVDLLSLSPVGIPAGTGNVVLSWIDFNRLTTNSMGREWIPTKITDVMVGHYENLTISDLQEQFLNLQTGLASKTWTYRITSGQQVNLSQLTDESGHPFAGIDNTGIWIVGLTCGSCRNPAPWFLSVLAPCN